MYKMHLKTSNGSVNVGKIILFFFSFFVCLQTVTIRIHIGSLQAVPWYYFLGLSSKSPSIRVP